MRLPFIMLSTLFVLSFCVDWLIYRDVKRLKRRWARWVWVATALAMWALLAVTLLLPRRDAGADLQPVMWLLYTYLSLFIPKTVYALMSLVGMVLHRVQSMARGVRIGGGVVALVCFGAMWWGALVGRTGIEVTRQDVVSERLPKAFDGFKMVQISDIHCGTWGTDTAFMSRMVDTVNALQPDVVVFTGDIVNRHSAELKPFVDVLGRLKARYGVFSVLGNHDYGDYMDWPNEQAKRQDVRALVDMQRSMGWQMLLNEHRWIRCGSDSIALIGVENWGEPPFSVYGDLRKSYPDLMDSNYKVLLTHNPEHWNREVLAVSNIDLSLSGHTHAMQMVLSIGDWQWSPSVWKYKEWGGLYSKPNAEGKPLQLYVNIGLGEVALPFRLGATPEVTLLTLKTK